MAGMGGMGGCSGAGKLGRGGNGSLRNEAGDARLVAGGMRSFLSLMDSRVSFTSSPTLRPARMAWISLSLGLS
jgi:hypothetical protein